jgi:voltage-gated potassium channel
MASEKIEPSNDPLLSTEALTDKIQDVHPFEWVEPVKKKYIQTHYWLPALVVIDGLLYAAPLLLSFLNGEHLRWEDLNTWREIIESIGLLQLPRVVISASMIFMAIGMLYRARIAWALAIILTLPMMITSLMTHGKPGAFFFYTLALLFLLVKNGQTFNRSSLAASSLFALSSFLLLLWYAFLGALYLGAEFQPPIHDLVTASYFSIVAMSTVGFGDIVPITHAARLFTISIIVLGLTVFVTSLGAVIGPIVGGALKNVFHQKAIRSMRKDHIILCGVSPFAVSVYSSLIAKGRPVTVVVPTAVPHRYPQNADIVEGDASGRSTLEEAGVVDAKYVLAMRIDDAENAFIVLAVKEIKQSKARTIAIVNANENLEKIRGVHPDLVLSPLLLGAELLSRALTGESMEGNIVSELFFSLNKSTPSN